jgi:protein disulfide-isomerase A1
MRLSSLIPAASALAFAALVAAEGTSDVLDLDASNFESSVNPEPMILVEFFAPWQVLVQFILRSH